MATRQSRLNLLVIAGVALVLVVLAWLILTASGLLPGDSGREPATTQTTAPGVGGLDALGWTLVVLAGTIVLGIAIAFGQMRSSRTTRAEEEVTEEATRELHRREQDPQFKD